MSLEGALYLGLTAAMMGVRAPHLRRAARIAVACTRETVLDRVLVTGVLLGMFLPLLWMATDVLAFADRASTVAPVAVGIACQLAGLWLLHRSHADLGANWSNTLELRSAHRLVTTGVYARVRHPMYIALLVFSAGQAFVVPNWIAGLSFFALFAVLVAARLGPEERMMREAFGAEWEAYVERTGRLFPGSLRANPHTV